MKRYPFKFLDSYSPDDIDIFFGRTEEVNVLYEMIFQSNIILVYGASGTGKTSLIKCGLATKFQSYDWLPLNIRRGNNINDTLARVLFGAGHEGLAGDSPSLNSSRNLVESLDAVYLSYFRPIYLIFDQFEELYILGSKKEQEQFVRNVQLILQAEQPVKMIFSIREEYLGHLFEFEKMVPQLLRKKLRVEPMNLEKVKQVLLGINDYKEGNVRLVEGEEKKIAEELFNKIRGKAKTLTIHLPYLQVLLDKLYMLITKDSSRQTDATFTLQTIEKIGNIDDVLKDFLEERVHLISKKCGTDENSIWKIISPFVTLEGTKEPNSLEGLKLRLSSVEANLIDETKKACVADGILRYIEDQDLYEIAHDSLAKCIAEKRTAEEVALLETRRFVKSHVGLKTGVRELFSESQLNRIDEHYKNLDIQEDEKSLIEESRAVVALRKKDEVAAKQREIEEMKVRAEIDRKSKARLRWALAATVFGIVVIVALAGWIVSENEKKIKELHEKKMTDATQQHGECVNQIKVALLSANRSMADKAFDKAKEIIKAAKETVLAFNKRDTLTKDIDIAEIDKLVSEVDTQINMKKVLDRADELLAQGLTFENNGTLERPIEYFQAELKYRDALKIINQNANAIGATDIRSKVESQLRFVEIKLKNSVIHIENKARVFLKEKEGCNEARRLLALIREVNPSNPSIGVIEAEIKLTESKKQ